MPSNRGMVAAPSRSSIAAGLIRKKKSSLYCIVCMHTITQYQCPKKIVHMIIILSVVWYLLQLKNFLSIHCFCISNQCYQRYLAIWVFRYMVLKELLAKFTRMAVCHIHYGHTSPHTILPMNRDYLHPFNHPIRHHNGLPVWLFWAFQIDIDA